MVDVWPKHSLAESDPWARRVSEATRGNERDIASLATQVTAQNQGTAASLDALRQQIIGLQEANERLNETVATLSSTASAEGGSGVGTSISAGSWQSTPAGNLPSLSFLTPTGKAVITLGGQTQEYIRVTFSIPGYVDRDAMNSSGKVFGFIGASIVLASRVFLVAGLPTDSPVTIQSEAFYAAGVGSAQGPSNITLLAQAIF